MGEGAEDALRRWRCLRSDLSAGDMVWAATATNDHRTTTRAARVRADVWAHGAVSVPARPDSAVRCVRQDGDADAWPVLGDRDDAAGARVVSTHNQRIGPRRIAERDL